MTVRVGSLLSRWTRIKQKLGARKDLKHALHNLHPSHKGSYSVERLQALNLYCQQASLLRVLYICLAVPAPALLVAVGTESVPLQDPAAGWKANSGAWIRLAIIGFTASVGLIVQTNEMVPMSRLPHWKVVLAASVTAVCYVTSQWALASAWVYPIPFGYILFAPVFATLVVTTFVMAIGRSTFHKNPTLALQLCKQLGIIMVQTSMVCVYPAFSALYFRLDSMYQTALVFTLPAIKFILQTAVVWFSSHIEESIPGVVVFSVEVFNALYVTKCMQSAKSYSTYAAILLFDAVDLVHAFYNMKSQLTNLHELQTQHSKQAINVAHTTTTLLDTVLSVCKEPRMLEQRTNSRIRIRSSLKLRDSPAALNRSIDKQLQDTDIPPSGIAVLPLDKSAVIPRQEDEDCRTGTRATATSSGLTLAAKRKFVFCSLKVLFQCEYVVLVKYVELAIPMIYSLYVIILHALPSVKYYPETHDMTSARVYNMALTVMAYAWMELLSLIALHFAVKRKFGISPIYMLAFVLENQATELQARLTVWFAYVLEFTLAHFGTLQPLALS